MPPLSRGLTSLAAKQSLFLRPVYARRYASTHSKILQLSEEVRDALETGKPVVALETTIYTHGFPYPENVALSSQLESLVRVNGGVPATIGILNGIARVGMEAEDLIELVSTAGSENTWKISRRDLGFVAGLGLKGFKLNGGTTIAGTMILAHLAGVKIFATGGLGGVHRGGENSMDVSADLTELGRTPVTVISSGCKSFLDIPRTLEYLETQGVGVGTFADGRTGDVDFPAFFSRDSGVKSPKVILNEAEAAAVIHAQSKFNLQSGLLFANPVPEVAGLSKQEIDVIITKAIEEADVQGIQGSANTPFILKRIRELSGGRSVGANKALIESNVIRGTKVAVELAKLELEEKVILKRINRTFATLHSASGIKGVSSSKSFEDEATPEDTELESSGPAEDRRQTPVEVLVAGSLASDLICDYQPLSGFSDSISPTPHTSNPAKISQTVGGVGFNVALAAHYSGATVALSSAVSNSIVGKNLIQQVHQRGLSSAGIRQLKDSDGARTAQYVAVNDTNKDLQVAMADMSIFSSPQLEDLEAWKATVSSHAPKWIVVDANWSPPILANIINAAKSCHTSVAFEPVSSQKAARLFQKTAKAILPEYVVPHHRINLATPNVHELGSMYMAARDADLFGSQHWWSFIDGLGLSVSGSRNKLIAITNTDLVDQGVPQQSIQLLPYIPSLVTKLGSQGCLLTCLLQPGDPRLTNPASAPYILSRAASVGSGVCGGVYMRLFQPAERVRPEDVISVNGVGDTMLGVLVAGLARSSIDCLEDLIPLAQKASVMTLKSREAVSPHITALQGAVSDMARRKPAAIDI